MNTGHIFNYYKHTQIKNKSFKALDMNSGIATLQLIFETNLL